MTSRNPPYRNRILRERDEKDLQSNGLLEYGESRAEQFRLHKRYVHSLGRNANHAYRACARDDKSDEAWVTVPTHFASPTTLVFYGFTPAQADLLWKDWIGQIDPEEKVAEVVEIEDFVDWAIRWCASVDYTPFDGSWGSWDPRGRFLMACGMDTKASLSIHGMSKTDQTAESKQGCLRDIRTWVYTKSNELMDVRLASKEREAAREAGVDALSLTMPVHLMVSGSEREETGIAPSQG